MKKKDIFQKKKVIIGLYIVALCLVIGCIKGYLELKDDEKLLVEKNRKLDPALVVKGQSIYLDGDEIYRFLPIPAGSISIQDSTGFRKISVESFLLGEVPVTSRFQAYIINKFVVPEDAAERIYDFPAPEGTLEQWEGFIEKLNKATGHRFRLPTSDEWDYAARGGIYTHNYEYAGGNDIDKVAQYKGNCKGFGYFAFRQKIPNELGLYDMSGGVWEITATILSERDRGIKELKKMITISSKKEPDKYKGLDSDFGDAHVAKGGSYSSSEEECKLNHHFHGQFVRTGARLVMDY